MGTSLRFKRSAKSINSTPVSMPSRINVLELDSLTRGDSNTLFNRGVALVVRCWLISFFIVFFCYLGFCSVLYLGSFCFVTMVVLLLLL